MYIREAPRMIGKYVMTEHELTKKRPTPESVGMGSYTIDSHNIQRYIMILGQSAATAAVVAMEGSMAVQDVPYEKLRERLVADGQVLEFERVQ